MEGREGMNSSGVTVVGSDAPSDYHVAPRTTENSLQVSSGSTPAIAPSETVTPPPPAVAGVAADTAATTGKKKRGRPRKYGPDGAVNSVALSPKPISSLVPSPVIDFTSSEKRGKVRSTGTVNKHQQPRMEVESVGPVKFIDVGPVNRCPNKDLLVNGEWVSCSVGANFTPHIITVNAGEDVTMKVVSFSQQGPRAICILSANGVISSVTLRQPDSSGGTLTYEGRFEILSLTGSFTPSETGGIRNRSGGMSVSLAGPDGRVVGGGVAGLLVAASPVQIVVGSFLAGNQHEQKTKKPKPNHIITAPTPAFTVSTTDSMEDPFRTSSAFRGDSWSALPPDSRNNKPADINVTLHG